MEASDQVVSYCSSSILKSGLNQGNGSGYGEKWIDKQYILQVESNYCWFLGGSR